MLTLDQVTFRHRKADQPYDFSLSAASGDIVGIMGPSGSGKSTLLDLIAGFQIPESGSIQWRDIELVSLPPENRPATILFQKNNLFEHLSAAENVAIGLNPGKRISTDEQLQVDRSLAQVGLTGIQQQRASTLSGGQQQRVALARAILRDRPLLLLDEPFTGLDDDTKSDMLAMIKAQATDQQKCVIMVTHDLSDCEAIATKRYNIADGKLIPVD